MCLRRGKGQFELEKPWRPNPDPLRWELTDTYSMDFERGRKSFLDFGYGLGKPGEEVNATPPVGYGIGIDAIGYWTYSDVNVLHYSHVCTNGIVTDFIADHWQGLEKWIKHNFTKCKIKSSQRKRTTAYVGPAAMAWRTQPGNYIAGDWTEPPNPVVKDYPPPYGKDVYVVDGIVRLQKQPPEHK
jgi:hypothetical protein